MGLIHRILWCLLLLSCAWPAVARAAEYPDGSWRLESTSFESGDWFGGAVSHVGNYILVGEPNDSGASGDAHLYQWSSGDGFTQVWSSDDGDDPSFGQSVVMSADFMVVVAPSRLNGGMSVGRLYVYTVGGGLPQLAYTLDGGSAWDEFGAILELHDNVLFVGSPGAGNLTGKVDVHVLGANDSNLWSTLVPGNGTETSLDYGRSIAVHELSDGTQTTVLLAIGAPGVNFPEWPVGGGRVYLYRLANGIWNETQVITPSISSADSSQFGCAVDFGGSWLAIGHEERAVDSGLPNGGVECHRWNGGVMEFQQQVLVPDPASTGLRFGAAVAMLPNWLVIGSPGNEDQGLDAGAAYLYEVDDLGQWQLHRKVKAFIGTPEEEFGACMDLVGGRLVIGTNARSEPDVAGSVWLYDYSDGSWQEDVPLVPVQIQTPASYAFPDDLQRPGGYFGWGVAADGAWAMATSPLEQAPSAPRVHFLRASGDEWGVTQSTPHASTVTPSIFGFSLDMAGDLAVLGDPNGLVDATGERSGYIHAYAYDGTTGLWEPLDGFLNFGLNDGAQVGCDVAVQAAASDGSHGERGVIGAFGVNDNDGAVFVISGEGQVDQIDPPVPGLAGGFGRSVSVLGNLLAVGSRPGVINDGTQIEPEVYLYLYDQGNDAWVHQQTISDPRPNTSGSSESSFGIEVQLARDPGAGRGGTSPWADVNLLVSAPGANDAFDQVGVIYSYRPTGSGSAPFALHQILRSGTPAPGNYFGAWFDVDQGLLVSTELGADELATSSGVIWAFEAVQQQDGTIDWIRMAKLIDPNAGQNNFSGFVALAGDAALVGSIGGTGAAPYTGNIGVYPSIRRSYWTGPDDGNWSDPSNWTPVAPSASRAAVFSLWPEGEQAVVLDEMAMNVPQFRVEHTALELDISSGLHYIGDDSSDDLIVKGAPSIGDTAVEITGFGTMQVRGDVRVGDDDRFGRVSVEAQSIVLAMGTWRQGSLGRLDYELPISAPWYAPFSSTSEPVLGGTLSVRNGLNVKPALGETYNIFASPEVEGDLATRFDLVSLPGLDDGHVFRLQYGADSERSGGYNTVVSLVVEAFDSLVGFSDPDTYDDVIDGVATGVETADLNGDGADEILVSVAGPAGSPGELYVFINDGLGGFATQEIYSVGSGPADVVVGYFEDGSGTVDSVADVVAVSCTLDDEVRLFRNDGAALLTEDAAPLSVGVGPLGMAVKDLDGDGNDELIVCASEERAIEIYDITESSRGSRAASQKITTPGKPKDIDPEDVDEQKGATSLGATTTDPSELLVMAVANDGVVGSPVSYPSGSEPGTIKSKDVDKDGKGDYVASNEESGTATLLKQSSTRGFEPPVMLPLGDAAGSLTVVDVDGDGDQDIVAVVDDGLGAEVRVLRNDMNLYGDEQLVFAAAATLETDVVPALLDAGDIDVDGYADLITIGSPRIQRRGATMTALEAHPNRRCLGDVDGDGAVDVLDLLEIISSWGPCLGCASDINADGQVDILDLLEVLSAWGGCDAER